jgi:hypothetical protein
MNPDSAQPPALLIPISKPRESQSRVASERFQLNHLLAGVTKANRHAAVDFGPPVGREAS